MEMIEYQKEALKTACYGKPDGMSWLYPALLLTEEAGEVAGKLAKTVRGDKGLDKKEIEKELGDCLWAIAVLAHELEIKLEDVAIGNILKLQDRQKRGVLKGSGDNR